MIRPWLRFFRVVNLPTVPGDVLVGSASCFAAISLAGLSLGDDVAALVRSALCAAAASLFVYLFGLADNDLVGARADSTARPIPAGEISPAAARLARALCLGGALATGLLAHLPRMWSFAAFALLVAIVLYNRTKSSLLMGLCRALNVVCGVFALPLACGWMLSAPFKALGCLAAAPIVWLAYVFFLTCCSVGEEHDEAKRQFVGFLIGALVYLQLVALVVFALIEPKTNRFLVVGAVLLVVLRVMRRLLPKVSPS